MSRKLLLADDSITIQKVIQITFAHEDYELTIVDNGAAALAKAMASTPEPVPMSRAREGHPRRPLRWRRQYSSMSRQPAVVP